MNALARLSPRQAIRNAAPRWRNLGPMRLLGLFVAGTIGFIAISYFEQLPIVGWLGAFISIAGWIMLGRAVAHDGASAFLTSAILGAWTGFVAAVTAWVFQTADLFGPTAAGLERVGAGFGFLGATLGLVYWPLMGALVCFVAAMLTLRRDTA